MKDGGSVRCAHAGIPLWDKLELVSDHIYFYILTQKSGNETL